MASTPDPNPPSDSPPDPKERLLDAAEALFAEYGFDGASLRAITATADANLAAVNYHFGSKEGLFQAVFKRRLDPINAERLALLDALESGPDAPALEAVLEAFFGPPMRAKSTSKDGGLMRLAGRMYSEPVERLAPILAQFEEVRTRFLGALQRALPDLPATELIWRLHFSIGAMSHVLIGTVRLQCVAGEHPMPPDDDASTLQRIIAYVAGGLRAPVGAAAAKERTR